MTGIDAARNEFALFTALMNCRELARRQIKKGGNSEWQHIIRFCDAVGVKPSITRNELYKSEDQRKWVDE